MGDLLHFTLPLIGGVNIVEACSGLAVYRPFMTAGVWVVWLLSVIALGTRFLGLGGRVAGEIENQPDAPPEESRWLGGGWYDF